MNVTKLLESLRKHEGLQLSAYQDSRGIWTIGYGRNLQELKISAEQAEDWLDDDMLAAQAEARKFPEFAFLDTDARRNAFVEMVFNMGAPRVRGFKRMLAAIQKQDWAEVALEAAHSKWATQVGKRADTIIGMLHTGKF